MIKPPSPSTEPARGGLVSLRHVVVGETQLPPPQVKPTSRTGQMESTLGVWQGSSGTSSGVWECEPGEFTAVRDDCTEICHILTGRATVIGDDGTSAEIGPGSLLVLAQGWRGTWIVHETIRKTYVMIAGATA